MLDRSLAVAHTHADVLQAEVLVLSVHAERHCRASPKRDRNVVVGAMIAINAERSALAIWKEGHATSIQPRCARVEHRASAFLSAWQEALIKHEKPGFFS